MDFSKWGQPSEEWLALEKANPEIRAPPPGSTPLEMQTIINNAYRQVSQSLLQSTGLKNLVSTQDYIVPVRDGQSITVRSYRPSSLTSGPPLPAYLYHHGGGFVLGNLETEGFQCAWLAHTLSLIVVHICYRCTPQYTGLTAWHDALDGFEWVMANLNVLGIDPTRVVVGGISAGGSLTATVVQNEVKRARETNTPVRIKGQVLGIPYLINPDRYPYHLFADKSKASLAQLEDVPVIPKSRLDLFQELLGSEVDPGNPTWCPGLASEDELKGTPQTVFLIAGYDPLRDEGLLYAQKLKNAGVRTKVHIFPGLPHAFHRFLQLPSRKRWNEVMLEGLRWAKADQDEWNVELPPPPEFVGAKSQDAATQ
ncbi:alpha/beta hydrolase fold-3 [Biscogniauxia marginata]|nr:alpha/beta hydrolase fold-3 [Biscogniauxia marginata]